MTLGATVVVVTDAVDVGRDVVVGREVVVTRDVVVGREVVVMRDGVVPAPAAPTVVGVLDAVTPGVVEETVEPDRASAE